MMRWNDSSTIDESSRQDRLVDAEIEQAKKGPQRALGVAVAAMVLAAVFFAMGNTIAGCAFIALPVLNFAGQFLNNVVSSRSSRSGDEKKRKSDDAS